VGQYSAGTDTSFLERFVPGAALDGLEQRAYYLQGGPKSAAEPSWMLGLSVLGELDPASIDASSETLTA
jgi:hypothetical protein